MAYNPEFGNVPPELHEHERGFDDPLWDAIRRCAWDIEEATGDDTCDKYTKIDALLENIRNTARDLFDEIPPLLVRGDYLTQPHERGDFYPRSVNIFPTNFDVNVYSTNPGVCKLLLCGDSEENDERVIIDASTLDVVTDYRSPDYAANYLEQYMPDEYKDLLQRLKTKEAFIDRIIGLKGFAPNVHRYGTLVARDIEQYIDTIARQYIPRDYGERICNYTIQVSPHEMHSYDISSNGHVMFVEPTPFYVHGVGFYDHTVIDDTCGGLQGGEACSQFHLLGTISTDDGRTQDVRIPVDHLDIFARAEDVPYF